MPGPDDTAAPPRRKPITKRLRFEILKRDGHRCHYCGATPDEKELVVDHVVPVALGGDNEPKNLVTSCRPCNSGKSSTVPDAEIVEDLDELAQAMADALWVVNRERMQHRDKMRTAVKEWHDKSWCRWKSKYDGEHLPLPAGWMGSIERFLTLGLDLTDLDRYVDMAMGSKANGEGVFSYMCGIAWNEIRDMQAAARKLVAEQLADDLLVGDGSEDLL